MKVPTIKGYKSQGQGLNSLSIIKRYGLTVKTKYFQHAKLFIERVQIL